MARPGLDQSRPANLWAPPPFGGADLLQSGRLFAPGWNYHGDDNNNYPAQRQLARANCKRAGSSLLLLLSFGPNLSCRLQPVAASCCCCLRLASV